jgi:hypothetical protein
MTQFSQVKTIIAGDPLRWQILRLVQELELPDCWISAGFVRSAIWDHLHQRSASPLPPDVDVIWYDSQRTAPDLDAHLEAVLRRKDQTITWSVKNQARMHLRNNDAPYSSAIEAMTHWPETATAVAVRRGVKGVLEVAAPLGLDDLFNLVVRPTAKYQTDKRQIYLNRLRSKNWLATWPSLKILPVG